MTSNSAPSSPIAISPTLTGTTVTKNESYDVEACKDRKQRSCFGVLHTRPSSAPAASADQYSTITRTLDGSPRGYSQIATFKSSDRNFMQYRSFGYLHSRLLLALQHDVEELERMLETIDQFDKTSPSGDPTKLICKENDDFENIPERIKESGFHAKFSKTRPQILDELKTKLAEYDRLLLTTKEITTLQRPSRRDYESVRDWFVDEKPLVEEESTYILRKEDVVTLRTGRECAAFDSFVERLISRADKLLVACFKCHLMKHIFMTPELRVKTSNKRLHYYDPLRVDRLINIIITFIIIVLMALPVVALYEISDIGQATPFEAIGVLIIFTLLFACAMSSLTKATRQELFGASAAYCAVLVVFISNFTTQEVAISGTSP